MSRYAAHQPLRTLTLILALILLAFSALLIVVYQGAHAVGVDRFRAIHAAIDAGWGVGEIALALLIVSSRKIVADNVRLLLLAAGMLTHGALLLFHSFMPEGFASLWTMTAAPFLGGALFVLSRVADRVPEKTRPARVMIAAFGIGLAATVAAVLHEGGPPLFLSLTDVPAARIGMIVGGGFYAVAAVDLFMAGRRRTEGETALFFSGLAATMAAVSLGQGIFVPAGLRLWAVQAGAASLSFALLAILFSHFRGAEEELYQSNRRLSIMAKGRADELDALLDTARVGIAWTRGRRWVKINRRFEEMFGYDRDELIDADTRLLFPDDESYSRFGGDVDRALAETGSYGVERVFVDKAGGRHWIGVSGRALDRGDLDRGVVWTFDDLTERERAAAALRESEARFRHVYHRSPVMMLTLATDNRVVEVNRSWEETTGLSGESVVGRPLSAFMEPPAARRFDGMVLPRLWRDGSLIDVEVILTQADGARLVGLLNGDVTRMPDGGQAALVTLRDMTAWKEAQQERSLLAAAFEQAREAVVITDRDGIIRYVNPAHETLTGYTAAELLGATPRLYRSDRHDTSFFASLWRTILVGDVWEGRVVNRRKDGVLYEQEMTISPVSGEDGRIVNFVAFSKDVSLESSLARAQEYFTAIASHELRTPLTKLELVRWMVAGAAADDSGLGDTLGVIDDIAASLKRIAEATSLLAELSGPHNPAAVIPVSLYGEVTGCVEAIRQEVVAEKRGLTIGMKLDGVTPTVQVRADHDIVVRVLREILVNAVKYTPDGKRIIVTASVGERYAAVEILDQGVGIAPERRADVFLPFFSLEDPMRHTTSQSRFQGGGIGIGLTLARLIMERVGGAIELGDPAVDGGQKVTLRFPLA
jgi:PAS domain S-box-containing protein